MEDAEWTSLTGRQMIALAVYYIAVLLFLLWFVAK
jgi:hypothetical protein